jgi:glutaminyl-tRNA synthetase
MTKDLIKEETEAKPRHFIQNIIDGDLKSGKRTKIVTRFPPEPNGFLHIGHAKAICICFGIAEEYSGVCNLRFDDTNPEKEDEIFANAICEDIKWLGFDWGEKVFHTSDYYETLYEYAIKLINDGKAFVCDLNAEKMREYRGDLKSGGKNAPRRDSSVEDNLELFQKMRKGEFEDGEYTLRAKIDMSSPNMNMRDPTLYRIKRATHQRTGDEWPIYPMYDFAHGQSDSIEGVTHSLCSLEFEDNRPLYNWFIENLELESKPQQIEFARLNLEYTVMSKRYLRQLVEENKVSGWDDPRMPTLSGMRRRGVPPQVIRNFCEMIGIAKKNSWIPMSTYEFCVRDHLGPISPRVFGVVDPLKVVITNYDDATLEIDAPFHPKDESFGKRKIPFSKEIYIEKDDFMEDAPKKFFRLAPGRNVRLKYAYVITCDEVIKDDSGEVIELRCSYHKDTFGGVTPEGMKKVKGIINWVSAKESIEVESRLYDRLFNRPNPMSKEQDFLEFLNPDSLKIVKSRVEPFLSGIKQNEVVQFERQGYFCLDIDSKSDGMVFNRVITLKDTWWKLEGELAEGSKT